MTISADFSRLCAEHDISMALSRSQDKCRDLVTVRREIAVALLALGHNYTAIGAVMDRDHTSIMYLVKPAMRAQKMAYGKRRYKDSLTAKT